MGVEKAVGLHMPRSADYAIGYVAALRAGGAYLPIEPALPASAVGTG